MGATALSSGSIAGQIYQGQDLAGRGPKSFGVQVPSVDITRINTR